MPRAGDAAAARAFKKTTGHSVRSVIAARKVTGTWSPGTDASGNISTSAAGRRKIGKQVAKAASGGASPEALKSMTNSLLISSEAQQRMDRINKRRAAQGRSTLTMVGSGPSGQRYKRVPAGSSRGGQFTS